MNDYRQHAIVLGVLAGKNVAHIIFDVKDADGRPYRLEVQSTPNGRNAIAFVVHNPWTTKNEGPNAGTSYEDGHVAENGFICLGEHHTSQDLLDSPYPVDFALKRAVFWTTLFSYFMETGEFWHPDEEGGFTFGAAVEEVDGNVEDYEEDDDGGDDDGGDDDGGDDDGGDDDGGDDDASGDE
jgi:hypothetical protein